MFNCCDKVRINCPYFNDKINGKIGKIVSVAKYDEFLDDDFYIVEVIGKENDKNLNFYLLVPSDYLTKIPKITSKQRTVLEGLYLLGYRYLACDDIRNALVAYEIRPCKAEAIWYGGIHSISVNNITKVLNNLCSWEDKKPTSIEWLLGKKDKNE